MMINENSTDVDSITTKGNTWIISQTLPFKGEVKTTSKEWEEMGFYTRFLSTPDLIYAKIRLLIPFCGNQLDTCRSRVMLMFDDTVIANSARYSNSPLDLHDLH